MAHQSQWQLRRQRDASRQPEQMAQSRLAWLSQLHRERQQLFRRLTAEHELTVRLMARKHSNPPATAPTPAAIRKCRPPSSAPIEGGTASSSAGRTPSNPPRHYRELCADLTRLNDIAALERQSPRRSDASEPFFASLVTHRYAWLFADEKIAQTPSARCGM